MKAQKSGELIWLTQTLARRIGRYLERRAQMNESSSNNDGGQLAAREAAFKPEPRVN